MIVPDPLNDLLPIDHPALFDRLPGDERRWRLRLYLACWGMGCPDGLSWAMALEDGAVHVAESVAILGGISDEAIRTAVANRARSEIAMQSERSRRGVAATRPPAPMRSSRAASPAPHARHLSEPTLPVPVESTQEFLDRLLTESRTRPQQPSKVTLLVPPMRRRVPED
jgi:hypothetical protein